MSVLMPKRYHVRPLPNGRWVVIHEDAKRSSATVETEAQAVSRAEQLARLARADVFFVHARDGKVRTVPVPLICDRSLER